MDYNAAPTGRSWRVDVYDTIYAAPTGSALTAYAYCRRNQPKKRKRGARRRAASVASFGTGSVEIEPAVPVTHTLAG